MEPIDDPRTRPRKLFSPQKSKCDVSAKVMVIMMMIMVMTPTWVVECKSEVKDWGVRPPELSLKGPIAVIKVEEPQFQIFAMNEETVVPQLVAIRREMKEIKKFVQKLTEPTAMSLWEARNFCPTLAGNEAPADPTIGPHPAYLFNPSNPKIALFTKPVHNGSSCFYAIEPYVLTALQYSIPFFHWDEQSSAWKHLAKLLSPHCRPEAYSRGELSSNYISYTFNHGAAYNIVLCGEMCRNHRSLMMRNCSRQDFVSNRQCGEAGCRIYSYNLKSNECRFSADPDQVKLENWYSYKNGTSSYGGITAINVLVECQSPLALPPLPLRAPKTASKPNFPVYAGRATCTFEPHVPSNFQVHVRCNTNAAYLKTILGPIQLRFKNTLHFLTKKNKQRSKRNTFEMVPQIQKQKSTQIISFISDQILGLAPSLSVIPAAGPVLGALACVAGSMFKLISHAALGVRSSGRHLIHYKHIEMKQASPWFFNASDPEVDSYKGPISKYVSVPEWISQIEELVSNLEKNIEFLVEDWMPKKKKTRKYLQNVEDINLVAYFIPPNRIRRHFFWKKKAEGSNTFYAILSLDNNVNIREGWVSTKVGVKDDNGDDEEENDAQTYNPGMVSLNCVREILQNFSPSHHCFASNWGASKISTFPISSHFRVVKILIKSFVKIFCPDIPPSLHHSEGIFLAVVSRACEVHLNENIIAPKERISTLFTFKVLINASPPQNDTALPLTTSLKKAIVSAIREKKAEPILLVGLAWLACISIALLLFCARHMWKIQSSGQVPSEMRIIDRWKIDSPPSAPAPPLRPPTWRLPSPQTHHIVLKTSTSSTDK